MESTAETITIIDYIDRNVYNHHLYASLPPLYYTRQGARTMAVHRNAEMEINGCDTLETERLDYMKVPFFSSFSLMKNPSL